MIIEVTVWNGIGCQLSAIDSCTSIYVPEIKNSDKIGLKIYPNPTSTFFTIELERANLKFPLNFQILDIFGRLIKVSIVTENISKFESKDLRSGIYILSIFNDHEIKAVSKLIIE